MNRARDCGPRPFGKCFSWKTPPWQPAGAALAGPEKRFGGAVRADARRGEDFACGQNGPYCDSGRPVPPCRAACIAASNRPFRGGCVRLLPGVGAGKGAEVAVGQPLARCGGNCGFCARRRPAARGCGPRRAVCRAFSQHSGLSAHPGGAVRRAAPRRASPCPQAQKREGRGAEFGFFALTLQP